MDPLDLLINMISVQELQLVSGVCSLLDVVRSADPRGGLRRGRYVARCTDCPFGGAGTLYTSFGAVSDTPAGSPHGWNPNRR